jgi:pimeloyl-ACP methyl ester carboxylesterase
MQVRGIDLAVTILGTGRPFIWGHGMTWSRALEEESGLFLWHGLADLLQIIRYDARGHGTSEASYLAADYQWPNLAADMLGVADAVGAPCFLAGGASMGCATALYAALAAPERINALCLVIPPTAWETRAAQADLYDNLAHMVETQGLASLVALLKQRPLLPQFLLEAIPTLEEISLQHIAALQERMVPALLRGAGLSNFPARDTLQTLTMPVLILAWADDAGHPVSTATELGRLLPQARLHIASSLQEIQAWPEVLRNFVQQLP